MYKIDNLPYSITIGKTGENEARSFYINCRPWLMNFPGGSMSIVFLRPDGERKRTVLTVSNGCVAWTPTSEELAVAGVGYAEIQLTYEGVIAKSTTVQVKVEKSVEDFDSPYTPPSPSGYYIKPIGGIPYSDLSESVQASLDAADAAQPLIDADHKLPYEFISGAPESGGLKTAYYYTDLETAITDINAYFTRRSDVSAEDGAVRVNVLPDGSITVTLLDDMTVMSPLRPKTGFVLDLSGHTIYTTALALFIVSTADAISITVDGRVNGSAITVENGLDSQTLVAQLQYTGAASAHFNMLGGRISISGSRAMACAVRAIGFDVRFDGCEISAELDGSNEAPGCLGVWLQNNARAEILNTEITADYSGSGDGTTYAVYNQSGDVYAENSDFLADAAYGGEKCYNTKAVESTAASRARLKNCSAIGLHSGATNSGLLIVDGGTLQAIGHGGVYTAGNGISRIRNAVVGKGSYEGRAQIPGASIHAAAFYLGSSEDDHPVVYMDGCTLDGNTEHQFIVVRQTTDARLYISNTEIPTGYFIRVDQLEDGDNIVYSGVGCNIGADNICLRTGTYESGGVTYSEVTVAADGIYTPSATEILTVDPDAIADHLVLTEVEYAFIDVDEGSLSDLKTQLEVAIAGKQDKLTAGANITIEDGVISATGGGSEIDPYDSSPEALGSAASAGVSDDYARGDHMHPRPSAADIGAIAAPANPSSGQYLKWDGSAWVADSLPIYNGGVS